MRGRPTCPVIDAHVHLNNYHEDQIVPIRLSLDRLLESMQQNRVDSAIVLTSYKVSPHRPATREVVEAVAQLPNVFVVAGVSYLDYRERDLREIAEYLEDGRVKGLKLYPGYEPFYPWDRRCQVVFDLCKEYDVPLMVHSGDTYTTGGRLKYAHPLEIDELAVDHPEMKIVICHLGNPWLRDCMEVIYKNKNVYADISGLVLGDFDTKFERWIKPQIEEVLLYVGDPRRLLYGTDWPISSMESYLEFIGKLDMPRESKEQILYRNTAELFRLPVAAPLPQTGRA